MKKLFFKSCIVLFVLFLQNTSFAQFQTCVDFPICFSSSAENSFCDLEICIVQSMQCHGQEPVAFRTCSTVRPNTTGKLCYMVPSLGSECVFSVMDITIRRINTGETITLSATTSGANPTTAQQFFDYATTGHTTGSSIKALGVFQVGCNGQPLQPSKTLFFGTTTSSPPCLFTF